MHAHLSLQQPSLRAPARSGARVASVGLASSSRPPPSSLTRALATTKPDARAEDLATEAPSTSASSTRRAAILGLALAATTVATTPGRAHADGAAPAGSRVFLDVKIDGEPAGRIEIELLPDAAPVGARRFADLTEEKDSVGYRNAKWDGIFVEQGYLRCAGAKSLSYSASGISQIAGGDSTLDLEREMDDAPKRLSHDRAGLVSLVVREAEARPVKERLVAMGGKLVTLTSQAGEAPNGSAFCITLKAAPELDKTNLVVGRLIPGPGTDAAVAALAALPVNRPREGIQKPFFDAGKAIGDSRAIVAEKGFYRPLKRAIISGGGVL
jgi:peptidyl-prolyl cis-trans isomerase B (cyclophilin B)